MHATYAHAMHACHVMHVCHASCAMHVRLASGGWKNKRPSKCNLFWARKVLEIFEYSDLLSGTEYAGNM